jgi:hypothetical protein
MIHINDSNARALTNRCRVIYGVFPPKLRISDSRHQLIVVVAAMLMFYSVYSVEIDDLVHQRVADMEIRVPVNRASTSWPGLQRLQPQERDNRYGALAIEGCEHVAHFLHVLLVHCLTWWGVAPTGSRSSPGCQPMIGSFGTSGSDVSQSNQANVERR